MPEIFQERAHGSPFLGLNRPQYANMPELLVSGMLWGILENSPAGKSLELNLDGEDDTYDAVAYDRREVTNPRNLNIGYTRPGNDSARWSKVVDCLRDELDISTENANLAATILLGDLRALRPAKSKSYAALPINVEAALFQDTRGLLRVANPANYASILERMYVLGGGRGTASGKLFEVLSDDVSSMPTWLQAALEHSAPDYVEPARKIIVDAVTNGTHAPTTTQPGWLAGRDTPFSWFAGAWDSLCQDGWIARMPRRRWIDWASCVLRNALGMGFLFEMNFFRSLVLGIVSDESTEAVARSALSVSRPLLRWDDAARVSERSVREQIKTAAQQGTASMALARKWIEAGCADPMDYVNDTDGLAAWLQDAREWARKKGIENIEAEIAEAFETASEARSANNVDETIVYALRERSDAPGASDLYGLLKRRGRYEVVDPGQEWLVVLSSLSAGGKQSVTRIADVDRSLRSLRLRPGYPAIVRRLEASGLARGSHDADEAIEVQVAF